MLDFSIVATLKHRRRTRMSSDTEYVTLDDAATATGIKKGSLYYYLRELGIETHKFPLSKHAYIAKEDVERIVEAKKAPWKINQAKLRNQNAENKEAA